MSTLTAEGENEATLQRNSSLFKTHSMANVGASFLENQTNGAAEKMQMALYSEGRILRIILMKDQV